MEVIRKWFRGRDWGLKMGKFEERATESQAERMEVLRDKQVRRERLAALSHLLLFRIEVDRAHCTWAVRSRDFERAVRFADRVDRNEVRGRAVLDARHANNKLEARGIK